MIYVKTSTGATEITPYGISEVWVKTVKGADKVYSSGVALSTLPLGTLICIQENGVNANYEIAGFDVHGVGTATLVRKKIVSFSKFGNGETYNNDTLDMVMRNFENNYSAELRSQILNTNIICVTSVFGQFVTLQRKIFALSYTEVGFGANYGTLENAALPWFNSDERRWRVYIYESQWWLRSYSGAGKARSVLLGGSAYNDNIADANGVVPAFVLPSTVKVTVEANADGSYNLVL